VSESILTNREKSAAAKSAGRSRETLDERRAAPELTDLQRELVSLCEQTVIQLGLSRSLGQIFGVIYCLPMPLAFADVVRYLDISKGSISQGLNLLCELEAIRLVQPAAGGRVLYAPAAELKKLALRLYQIRLRAPIEQGEQRLIALRARLAASEEPDCDFLHQRLSVLQTWHRKALRVLPIVERTLEGSRT
jgi:DNA-binding transcriptional regulator GbsR (MarR family)